MAFFSLFRCLEKNADHRPWSVEVVEHPFIKESEEDCEEVIGMHLHKKCPKWKQNKLNVSFTFIGSEEIAACD